jgi:hypothetical protein
VGAHRTPAKRGRGWIAFAWAALATGVLVVGGLYGLSLVNPAISFELPELSGDGALPGASPTPEPEVAAVTDPDLVDPDFDLSISVLNGSPTDGLQNDAVAQINEAGWPRPVGSLAGTREQEATRIYYNGAKFEGIAKGLAELMGTDPANVVNSDFYLGAPVTIVLGADYTPPAD